MIVRLIAVVFSILCRFQAQDNGRSANFIHVPIDQIVKLEDIVVVLPFNRTFGTSTTTTMFALDVVSEDCITGTVDSSSSNTGSTSIRSTFSWITFGAIPFLFLAATMIYCGKKLQPTTKGKKSKIVCVYIMGHNFAYNVDLYGTVGEIKKKIGQRIGSDVINDQFLIFAGKRLLDDKRLIDYNVQMHSTLNLSGRILGGASPARFCAGARQSTRNNGGRGDRGTGRGRGGRGTNKNGDTRQSMSNSRTVYSEDKVLFYGLLFAGFDESRQKSVKHEKNKERFICFYGVTHKAVTALIKDLPQKDFNLKNFLLTLNYLKTYNTETILSGWWKESEDTIRKWTKHYQKAIQKLKKKKIYMGDFKYDTIFILTVDGVHFRTHESRKNPSSKKYSHKFHGPGLSYEIAIAINEDRVVSINGPEDASQADITTFRDSLIHEIPEGKRGIGDSGYKGEPTKLSFHRPNHSKDMTNYINRARARHENFNARIKNYSILSNCFRSNEKAKHQMAFEAVCILVQYDMENGRPLMEM